MNQYKHEHCSWAKLVKHTSQFIGSHGNWCGVNHFASLITLYTEYCPIQLYHNAGGGGGGDSPLNLGWGCAAECLRTWPCSRLKRRNFATMFQTKSWKWIPCSRLKNVRWSCPSNRKRRVWVSVQRDPSGSRVCTAILAAKWSPRPCSRVRMAKTIPFQTEMLICRPCSRLRGKNHTLLSGTSPYSPYVGSPLPGS